MIDPAMRDLWQRFFREGLDLREKETLAKWIEEEGQEEEMETLLKNTWEEFQPGEIIPVPEAERMLQSIMRQVRNMPVMPAPVISIKTKRWKWTTVAASIFLIVSIGGYFIFFDNSRNKQAADTQRPFARDIQPPSTNRATITLDGGETIDLDSVASGTLTSQQQVLLTKLSDGKIAYNGSASELLYNTLTNPRGSKVIDMTLADGSHIWLNAGSSVTYPVAFVGTERRVQVNGEAYFEVAHDPGKPFFVTRGEMTVQVLGTHFNVNAYDDERDIRVTLLEGSVEVQNQSFKARIKPGEQAIVAGGGQLVINKQVDLEQVTAWKNGKFDFGEGTDLKVIMRQLARWYDVDVEYNKEINQEFIGTISRQVNVSKVLEKFELTGRAHFKIESKKIVVYP